MTDIGLMYCPEEIQAFLEHRKTLARRTRGLGEINDNPDEWVAALYFSDGWWHFFKTQDAVHRHKPDMAIKCPFPVGARVYAKETFSTNPIHYKADGYELQEGEGQWHSSMFMPKRFARIWRPIIGVRPERVQDITEADAKREGVMALIASDETDYRSGYRAAFADLWDRLNGKRYSWKDNPYVWVISFRLLTPSTQ